MKLLFDDLNQSWRLALSFQHNRPLRNSSLKHIETIYRVTMA